jgi:hypothetical protein
MTNRLHWTHENAAAAALRGAFPDDDVVCTGDPLLNGPILPLRDHDTLADWLQRRCDWLCEEFGTEFEDEQRSGLEQFAAAFEQLHAFDDVVVWVADTVGSQLFFCWAVAVFERWGRDHGIIRIGRPAHYPNESIPLNLGGCSSREFAGATVREPGQSEVETALQVWRAFSGASPASWSAVFGSASELELFDALPALFDRFPDRVTGLSLWETLLLEELRDENATTAYVIGNVLGKTWEYSRDAIGDGILFNRLVELSCPSGRGCLLQRWGTGASMRTDFSLTDVGRSVLDGEANRIYSMGLDRWIGGVHLDSRSGKVWCRSADGLEAAAFPDAPENVAQAAICTYHSEAEYPDGRLHIGGRAVSNAFPKERVWVLAPLGPDVEGRSVTGLSARAERIRREERRFLEKRAHCNERPLGPYDGATFVQEVAAASTVVVWVGDELEHVFRVGAVASVLVEEGRDPREVVEVGRFDSSQLRVHSAELSEVELHRDPPWVSLAADVWGAYVGGDPEELSDLAEANLDDDLLRVAVATIVAWYPDVSSGLSAGQRVSLEELERFGHPRSMEAYQNAKQLADPALARPLVEIQSDRDFEDGSRSYQLTDFGERVLAGEQNHVEVNGIDRWIGGMHLSSEEAHVWWRKNGRLVERRGED